MRWQGMRRSSNVEDRRGFGGGGKIALGGGGTIIVLLIAMLFGVNPMQLLNGMQGGPATPQAVDPAEQPLAEFSSVVLAQTEDVWNAHFQRMGQTYQPPRLVLFQDMVESACGSASAAVGPFYCPADRQVYLDLAFFEAMHQRLGAPGDFAQAYVIAHEVGHHVQNLLGVSQQVQSMRGRLSEREYNQLSVRLELQADFYAGVWAHDVAQIRDVIEPGDIEEALGAASAVGDDRLQKRSQGTVVPDAFTHGSSEQRVRWFKRGFETGDPSQGDTFNTDAL
jgi:predicted metalloprotease